MMAAALGLVVDESGRHSALGEAGRVRVRYEIEAWRKRRAPAFAREGSETEAAENERPHSLNRESVSAVNGQR
jgi:hypothetical protein